MDPVPSCRRLAIANPLRTAYSETFIAQQIRELSPVLRIHGYPVPNETIPGGSIAPGKLLARLLFYLRGLTPGLDKAASISDRELARRLRCKSVNVVLANFGYMAADVLPACVIASIPLVAHFHGLDAHRIDICESYSVKYRALAAQCAGVIAVSEQMKSALISLGFDEAKISVTRYGVDRNRFGTVRNPSREPRFLAVGRFVDKKAPYLTLCAFKDVFQHYPSAKLIFIGDGELLETTSNLASYFGLARNVEFRGKQTPAEIAEELSTATAFVQHSLSPHLGPARGDKEGTPVSVLEAMMSACPVVSVRHAGIGEVIDSGKDGVLVEERDVTAMAAAMLYLIRNPDFAVEIGNRAAAKARAQYSTENYIDSLKNIIQSASQD